MIRKKVEKLTDTKLNLKLINSQKTGELVWKLNVMNLIESFYSDDNEYTSNRKTTSFRGRVVRSISDHFSAGVFFWSVSKHL